MAFRGPSSAVVASYNPQEWGRHGAQVTGQFMPHAGSSPSGALRGNTREASGMEGNCFHLFPGDLNAFSLISERAIFYLSSLCLLSYLSLLLRRFQSCEKLFTEICLSSKHALAAASLFSKPRSAKYVCCHGRFPIALWRRICDTAEYILAAYRAPQPEPVRTHVVAFRCTIFPPTATTKWT